MNRRLNELLLRRGRLLERIATQRVVLEQEFEPVQAALCTTDRILVRARFVTEYVKKHPGIATLAVAALFILKAKHLWRWTKRGFIAWRTWRILSDRLTVLGLRTRS